MRAADIIFIPYNYIIDPVVRSSLDMSFEDSVVIIDEAHNLVQCCEDAYSFEIDTTVIEEAMKEVHSVAKLI